MAADTADGFQKELVDLFIEEAHEWLQNIHVALDELEQGPGRERHGELIAMMLSGVTNLGESASTINLLDVTDASFAAVPLIEAIKDPLKVPSVQDFFALCKQLGKIQSALTCATGLSFKADGNGTEEVTVREGLSPREFLQSLRELHENQSFNIAPGCNHIHNLIKEMEEQVQAGVEHIDVAVIQGYLARMAEAEESFLKTIDQQVPEVFKKVSALKMDGEEANSLKVSLEASLQDVARLREEAQQVNARSAVLFFTGLHSLLTVVAQRRVQLAATRVESVKVRLHAMGEAIRQWAEHGRAQRAAINRLLPVSRS